MRPPTKDVMQPRVASAAPPRSPPGSGSAGVAAARRVVADLFGPPAQRRFSVEYWDGSTECPPGEPAFTLGLRRPSALRRMLLPVNELSLVEAYLFGGIDIDGDLEAAAVLGEGAAARVASLRAVMRLLRDVLALPSSDEAPSPARMRRAVRMFRFGRSHTPGRDAQAVRFHYDVGNAFYALWLDAQMVYSCGYFPRGDESLEAGQHAKLEHVCRKLRLQPGERMLDIGCGWGALPIHAARHYGVQATGITVSAEQAAFARERVAREGLADRVHIELRDYRTLAAPGEAGRYDKLASIGMVEHVGRRQLDTYFAAAYHALKPGGLFLNHGIVSRGRAMPRTVRDAATSLVWRHNQFIRRYVFPDGEIVPAATVIASAERSRFETRDVENLREHYVTTLRHWVRRLEHNATAARDQVGDLTYRVWRLYMAASAHGFATSRIGVIQALLAKPDASGHVHLPRTRDDLAAPVYVPLGR